MLFSYVFSYVCYMLCSYEVFLRGVPMLLVYVVFP